MVTGEQGWLAKLLFTLAHQNGLDNANGDKEGGE